MIANTLLARNIVVETVFITDFKFSPAFASQIESKVVAFQKYLTEQNNLKAVQVVANQTVVQLMQQQDQTSLRLVVSHKQSRLLLDN